MNCERFDELVDLHVAGELAGDPGRELEEHAGQCPVCGPALEAARRRHDRLDRALAAARLRDGFVTHTLGRILAAARARPEPEPDRGPESLTSRLLRYAALAAAAALFILAGYGLVQRRSVARVRKGDVSLASLDAGSDAQPRRPLSPGHVLSSGDVIRTPENAKAVCVVDLANGRMRAVLAPNTCIRIGDPRRGTVAYVDQGDLYWRVDSSVGAPVVVSPLARIAAARGAISIHVASLPRRSARPGPFRGVVTLAVKEGSARVVLAGRSGRTLDLRRGQVVTLCTHETRPAIPCTFVDVFASLRERLGQIERQQAHLHQRWQLISAAVRTVPSGQLPALFRDGTRTRTALAQATVVRARIIRRLDLLRRYDRQGQSIFGAELRPVSHSR